MIGVTLIYLFKVKFVKYTIIHYGAVYIMLCKYAGRTTLKILIDTLSMTWKLDNLEYLYEKLNLFGVHTEPIRTKYYAYGEYYCGILIAYNTDEQGNITDTFLDISGKGCRTVEQLNPDFDWFTFLHDFDSLIRSRTCHISRLDIACDIDDDTVTIGQILRCSNAGMYVCKSKVLPDVRLQRTREVYFGSPRSDRLLRIYDKALEQGIPDTQWVRIEFQLRNDNALSLYLNWCNMPDDIGLLFRGVLADYLRFVSVPRGCSMKKIRDSKNYGNLDTAPWWDKLLGDASKIHQLYLPGESYTIERLEAYLERQTYSSLKTYSIAHDGDLTKIIEGVKNKKLNIKQQQLLDELKRINITTAKSDFEE